MKEETVYIILAGIFITNIMVAELIGGKLIHTPLIYPGHSLIKEK